jgi:hypothetical protein
MLRKFGWFPVTYERDGRVTSIVNAVFHDPIEGEVTIDDGYDQRDLGVDRIIALSDQEFQFVSSGGAKVTLRQTVAADAASWDRLALRIDLPVEIIGAIMSNTINAEPVITAAIDDDGDVHTMVLETALGLYARYARTWIRMGDISAIESLEIVSVPPDDLEIYDQADDAGQTSNIRYMHPVSQPHLAAIDVAPAPTPVTAGAAMAVGAVVITSAADLPDAIAFAATDAGAGSRWYVTRRARALGHADTLPWEDQ